MTQTIHTLLTQYLSEVQKIYGAHLKSVILYGSYAKGDSTSDSDVESGRYRQSKKFKESPVCK